MQHRKESSAIQKILMGFLLRCPNCEQGHISDGIISIRHSCEVCGVIYERKSGESVGASIIWLSVLPFMALVLFFVLYTINDEWSLLILLGIPLAFVILAGAGGYRNARGIWIALTYLTGGVYADDSRPDEVNE